MWAVFSVANTGVAWWGSESRVDSGRGDAEEKAGASSVQGTGKHHEDLTVRTVTQCGIQDASALGVLHESLPP